MTGLEYSEKKRWLVIVMIMLYAAGYGLILWKVGWFAGLGIFFIQFGQNVENRIKGFGV